MRTTLALAGFCLAGGMFTLVTADGQTPGVTVVGPITNGHCVSFSSNLVLQDGGAVCPGPGGNTLTLGGPGIGNGTLNLNGNTSGNSTVRATNIGNLSLITNQSGGVITLSEITDGVMLAVQDPGAMIANQITVLPAATGNAPAITATGTDTNVGINFNSKGTSGFTFLANGGANTVFNVNGSTTAVNFLQINSANTGGFPSLAAAGTDANPGIVLQPKGTGSIAVAGGTNNATLQLIGLTSGNVFLIGSATGGHLSYAGSGTAPTVTAGCNGAGSSISGTDIAGTLNGQTAAATTCTITFGTAFAAAPNCTVSGQTTPVTSYTPGTGTLVINFASTASAKFNWTCYGA